MNLALVVLLAVYLFAIFSDIRGSYMSGDEQGFLTNFADRGVEGFFDWRYYFWVTFVVGLASVHKALPLLLPTLLMLGVLRQLVMRKVFTYVALLSLLFLPTVFYFLNSYLRDPIFMVYSVVMLWLLSNHGKTPVRYGAPILLGFIIVASMRPFYGFIFLFCYLISHEYFSKYFKLILLSIFGVFVLSAVLVAVNQSVYAAYFDFFLSGHLREKPEVGVLMTPTELFDQGAAAVNFIFSPLYFWLIPATGFGARYDLLLYFENLIILGLLVLAILRFKVASLREDRALRFAWCAIALSCFMAAATTIHLDSYRFRLIFIPFLLYAAMSIRPRKRWLRLFGQPGGGNKVESRHG